MELKSHLLYMQILISCYKTSANNVFLIAFIYPK